MATWLADNFLRVGVIALVMDQISRFYFQIGMNWLTEAAAGRGATLAETMIYARVATALDMAASLLWWLFTLGFAMRVLRELRERRSGDS
jgi:hypothetical protein